MNVINTVDNDFPCCFEPLQMTIIFNPKSIKWKANKLVILKGLGFRVDHSLLNQASLFPPHTSIQIEIYDMLKMNFLYISLPFLYFYATLAPHIIQELISKDENEDVMR